MKSEINADDSSPQKTKAFNVNNNRINIINTYNNIPIDDILKGSYTNIISHLRIQIVQKYALSYLINIFVYLYL